MLLCLACAAAAAAMDQITLRHHGKLVTVEGRVEITGQDESILLLARDGVLWPIMPDEIVKHTSDKTPYQALSVAEMTREMKGQLPKGFEVYETTHYLIFHSTSRAYAHWCGTLLERLYTAFHTFWMRKGFDLAEPDSRLVAVIFADEASYLQYLHGELGGNGGQMIGYFNLITDRVNMYDLTGTQSAGRANRLGSGADQPGALRAGRGAERGHDRPRGHAPDRLQLRPAHAAERLPLVVQRGDRRLLRDPRSPQRQGLERHGRGEPDAAAPVSAVSPPAAERLAANAHQHRQALQGHQPGLGRLRRGLALTYFLVRQHSKQYVEYLRMLSAKKPILTDTPQDRIEQFQRHFGDLKHLDAEFLRYMAKVR